MHMRAYNPTTGSAYYGPRHDHNPATLAALGLLIEGAATNLCLRSAEFDNASWTKAASTVTANQYSSPDGNSTADRLVSDATSAQHYARQAITYSAGVQAFSLFVKFDSYARMYLRAFDGTSNFWATFNISSGAAAGTVGSGVTSTILALANGWYRVTMSFTALAAVGFVETGFANADGYSGSAFSGTVSDFIALWGAQLETDSIATSYIPTAGATASRAADVATMTGSNFSSWFNASEGTFYVEAVSPGSGTRPVISADDNTANEKFNLYTSTLDPKFLITDGGVTQADIDAGAITASTAFKLAAAFKVNDCSASVNGGAEVNDTSATMPTVDRLRIGADQAGNYLNGHVKAVQFHATNRDTQALTA